MKLMLLNLYTFLVLTCGAFADEAVFGQAQAAYDDGRYAEAVMLYTKLIDTGIDNHELHFNLANAYFKDADLPNAVWHYRKAWYDAPRDPDIQANLHFALNASGAVEPEPSFIEKILNTMSAGEWVVAATTGYMLAIALLAAALLARPWRKQFIKLCGLPLVLLALSASGWWHWHQYEQHPEWVVIQTEATALFGPVEGSTAHYKIPLGALVRQRTINPKGWIEVEYDGKRGWLQQLYISRLSP